MLGGNPRLTTLRTHSPTASEVVSTWHSLLSIWPIGSEDRFWLTRLLLSFPKGIEIKAFGFSKFVGYTIGTRIIPVTGTLRILTIHSMAVSSIAPVR